MAGNNNRNNCLVIITLLMILCILPSQALALPSEITEMKPDPPQKDKRVILLIVDGLQAESINPSGTPSLNGLGLSGIIAEKTAAMPPDNSIARLYTVLSGVDPQVHGFTEAGKVPKTNMLLNEMESKNIKTGIVDGTGFLAGAAGDISYKNFGPFDNDEQVLGSAIDLIKGKKTFLTAVIFTGPGKHLAREGIDSREYNESVKAVDTIIGKLINQLHIDGIYNSTLLIVTGTTGKPPLIIKCSEFLSGIKMAPVCLKDIAPTLAYLYGMNTPKEKGLIMWNALKPSEYRTEIVMLNERVKDLSNAYANAISSAAKLEAEKRLVQEEKLLMAKDIQFIENEIQAREKEISRLNTIISVMKLIGIGLLPIVSAMMFIEYKYLKKKYLFFT